MNSKLAGAVAIGISTLVLSACGGGDGGATVGTTSPTPTAQPQGLAVSYNSQVQSAGNDSYAAPVADAQNSGSYVDPNHNARSFAVGNFGGNGCPAVIVAPSYYNVTPQLPVQIWTSDCHGHFTLATSTVISGTIPTTGFADAVLVGDFNKSGQDSVLIIDQGLENSDANNPGFSGAKNHLLLNQGGKLVDVSSTNLPQDGMNFNHVSTMYHANVPGGQTVVLTRLGGPAVAGFGVEFLVNDGTGNFAANASQLPPELAYTLNTAWNNAVDYVQAGTALLADLDNSGSPYLIAGTYRDGTTLTHQNAVFIYKLVSGVYQKYATVPIPAAYANIAPSPGSTQHLGVSNIVVGDFEGTGHPDLAVLWEGAGMARLQLIHNDGAGNFTDITASANVPAIDVNQGSNIWPASSLQAISLNGTGDIELAIGPIVATSLAQMASWRPVLRWTNGQFQYMDIFNGADINTIAAQIGVDTNTPVEFTFGHFGTTKTDLLVRSWAAPITQGAFNNVYIDTFHTFLHL